MQPADPSNHPSPSNHRSQKRRVATYGVLTLLGTGALVLLNQTTPSRASLPDWLAVQPQMLSQQVPSASEPSLIQSNGDSNFIATAVDRVGPSVVRIDSARTVVQQFLEPLEPGRHGRSDLSFRFQPLQVGKF